MASIPFSIKGLQYLLRSRPHGSRRFSLNLMDPHVTMVVWMLKWSNDLDDLGTTILGETSLYWWFQPSNLVKMLHIKKSFFYTICWCISYTMLYHLFLANVGGLLGGTGLTTARSPRHLEERKSFPRPKAESAGMTKDKK